MYEERAKSLRWLAFNFPHIDNPQDDSDKMCNRINIYCTQAARAIEELSKRVPPVPHGRLIDADDFIIRITELAQKAKADGFDLGVAWYTAFIRHIEIAPTIIPAESPKEEKK